MRRPVTIVVAALVASVAAGCRTSPRKDLVEAELRVKDRDLRELHAELERTDAYNQYLQRELGHLQQAHPGDPIVEGVSPFAVKNLTLGRQTGGVDEDRCPGDEALQVIVEPRDCDNHVLKAAGMAQVHAVEITPEGVKRPLSTWQVDAESLRKSWRTGLLSTGYFLTLPWKVTPTTQKMRVVVQFVGQDNRLFEADRDITLRLIPEAQRKDFPVMPPATNPDPTPAPPPLPDPAPVLPQPSEGADSLPTPRKAEPGKEEEKVPVPPPVMPLALTATPERPLRGAVELLKPVVTRTD
jgi:hypothetical protein